MQQTYPDESSGDGVRKLVPAAREGRFRDTTLVSLSRVQQTVSCPARARGSSLRRCDALRTTTGAAAQLADAIWEVRLNAKRLAKAVQQQPPAPEAPTASSAFQEPTTNP